ncbi:hypothetical protein Taro_026036 [Colocasia esculenta]|uniref:Uncharacterized protein n=1 Tax=Colocasia esculenta TaxID=4460 RepID=A0A843VJD1_COLES|nr:hypothetical protein [Colocasia esculenta]
MTAMDFQLGMTIVSRETIKPSSPTPQHLLTRTLSWIDQVVLPAYSGLVLFYLQGADEGSCGANSTSGKLLPLKQSLSESLALYFPLAGRLDGTGATVNCHDEGIDFIQARARCPLSTVLQQPDAGMMDILLPCARRCDAAGCQEPLLIVKITTFECGGMALGFCHHHTVADGQSMALFLETWSAIARGVPSAEVRRPALDVAAWAFPPLRRPPPTSGMPSAGRQVVTRRFVLDGSKICALREQSAGDDHARRSDRQLTRVEAVTALIWRCCIRAASSSSGDQGGAASGEFAAGHIVDLRSRVRPALPETAFGNVASMVLTEAISCTSTTPLRRLTEQQISAAIRQVDGKYVRENLQDPEGLLAGRSRVGEYVRRGVKFVCFSSLWGFPFYEADFGWGRPAWVARAGLEALQLEGCVTLMGRREGGAAVEAWVGLSEEEMARFQQDPELLSILLPSDVDPVFWTSST